MQINPVSLDALFIGYSKAFQAGFATVPEVIWPKLAMPMSSDTSEEHYPFLDQMPRMREWLGERHYHNLIAGDYLIKNKSFEDSIEIDRDKILDDKFGIYKPAFEMLGRSVGMWRDDLVIAALLAGETTTCHDGQYFFDTDHPVDISGASSTTQVNLVTAATPLTAAAYAAQRAAGRAIVGADGTPWGIRYNLIIVPPALEKTAKEIVTANLVPNTAGTATQDNVYKGTAEVLVLDRLSAAAGGSDVDWYLADMSQPLKPLIFQLREEPTFKAFDKATDPNVFEKKKFRYGVDGRGNAGYGLWQYIRKIKGS